MMRRGMVLKLNNGYALIVTDDSDFIRIKLRDGMWIGQKIFIFDEDIIPLKEKNVKRSSTLNYLKVVAAMAACIAIIVIINISFVRDSRQLYAIVSLDINPSFELGIDETYNVVQIDAMNEDSKEILDFELIGEPLSVVVSEILFDVEESGYLLTPENAVLVSTVNFKKDDDEPLQKVVGDGVRLAMSKNTAYKSTKVIFIEADEEDLKAAEEQELSVGKYLLLEMCDNKIDKATIKKSRVSDLIKEEEIKGDLETDKTIEIISGEELHELNQMEKDIKYLKETVKQLKDTLDSDDLNKIEGLFNDIEMLENQLINEDSEFEEIREVIEKLHQIIEVEENELSEEEETDDIYEEEELEAITELEEKLENEELSEEDAEIIEEELETLYEEFEGEWEEEDELENEELLEAIAELEEKLENEELSEEDAEIIEKELEALYKEFEGEWEEEGELENEELLEAIAELEEKLENEELSEKEIEIIEEELEALYKEFESEWEEEDELIEEEEAEDADEEDEMIEEEETEDTDEEDELIDEEESEDTYDEEDWLEEEEDACKDEESEE